MPTLDHLRSVVLLRMVYVFLNALPERMRDDRRFRWTYVHAFRMCDKAIREYQAARQAFGEAETITISSDDSSVARKGQLVMEATDHLDTCVDATHRALAAAQILRVNGIGTDMLAPDTSAVRRLNAIRDAMQHAEERLIADNLRPGRLAFGPDDPYGISAREHDFTIGAETPVTYEEIAALLEGCYRFADVGGTMG